MLKCDFYNLKEPKPLSEQIATEEDADKGGITWAHFSSCEGVSWSVRYTYTWLTSLCIWDLLALSGSDYYHSLLLL